ncbi:hypothetical protein KY290_035328 [Solanum tuberosum]|uniref:Uncharacterized protein n=1 Tax=Solanum tuberosum TaxID=4113 RepID=A0ABQ7U5T4_SOLTU|nr:hypothetical protein KY290_035328 [Solanum tuberosum]
MAVSMFIAVNSTVKLNFPIVKKVDKVPIESFRGFYKPVRCFPVEQQVEAGIICEPCGGTGWLLCDFCKGQKTNVKSETNKIYRRCPSCRAVSNSNPENEKKNLVRPDNVWDPEKARRMK